MRSCHMLWRAAIHVKRHSGELRHVCQQELSEAEGRLAELRLDEAEALVKDEA